MREDIQGYKPLIEKKVKLHEAVAEVFDQNIMTLRTKFKNPLFFPVFYLTGKSIAVTQFERDVKENNLRIRSHLREYISQRKSGKR